MSCSWASTSSWTGSKQAETTASTSRFSNNSAISGGLAASQVATKTASTGFPLTREAETAVGRSACHSAWAMVELATHPMAAMVASAGGGRAVGSTTGMADVATAARKRRERRTVPGRWSQRIGSASLRDQAGTGFLIRAADLVCCSWCIGRKGGRSREEISQKSGSPMVRVRGVRGTFGRFWPFPQGARRAPSPPSLTSQEGSEILALTDHRDRRHRLSGAVRQRVRVLVSVSDGFVGRVAVGVVASDCLLKL